MTKRTLQGRSPSGNTELDKFVERWTYIMPGSITKAKFEEALLSLIDQTATNRCIQMNYWRRTPHEHKHTIDLGDPCYCGSDNCAMCELCGDENHD